MGNDFVKRSYNKAAKDYAAGRDQSENIVHLEILNKLLPHNSSILDIGCGAGKPVDSYLVIKGHKVIGIDISERMIELAKQNVPQADFRVEDMSDFKAEEFRVDAVVSFYAIFHTPRESHKDILRKINSFLRKGGYILITMGVDDWEGEEENFYGVNMRWSHYDAKANIGLVENAGFKILKEEIITTDAKQQIIFAQKYDVNK